MIMIVHPPETKLPKITILMALIGRSQYSMKSFLMTDRSTMTKDSVFMTPLWMDAELEKQTGKKSYAIKPRQIELQTI
eukprot:scaffold2384_cov143-Skeletonema_menzelii.AAC.24